jgi:hypothetical protein
VWIDDGDKYALVGLELKLEGALPPERIAPGLWVLTDTTFDVPAQWREWLGSIRADEVAGSNLFLVSKLASATPDILDGENQSLQQRVWHFYVGLLLSAMFSPSHKPVMLTGARRDGVIDIRQQKDLELPVPQVFRPYPPVVAGDILLAARLLDRIHQYCRCIDGLILPDIGKTKQQFKSRTELIIGPGHHDMMGALYDIRSNVEHLHENRYLETFDREVRLDLLKKEAIVEHIARVALARIVNHDALWPHFGNTAALEKFWALTPDERRKTWGDPIDPMASVEDFDPKYLHDGHLGKP